MLNQVEASGVLGLEHHLPARMRQNEQRHVGCAMRTQVIHDRGHSLGRARDPDLNVVEEVDPMRTAPSWIGMGEGFAGLGTECPEDVALGAATIIDLLPGPLGWSRLALHQCPTRVALALTGPISSRQITTLPAGGLV